MSMTTELAQRMKAAALKAKHAGEAPVMHFDERISALKEFQLTACPANVVDLVEALEASKQDVAKWFKAFEKAVSVGARYEEQIAELRVSNRILCSDAIAKQDHIAELEARTLIVKLPDEVSWEQEQFREEVIEILHAAGVAVEGE